MHGHAVRGTCARQTDAILETPVNPRLAAGYQTKTGGDRANGRVVEGKGQQHSLVMIKMTRVEIESSHVVKHLE